MPAGQKFQAWRESIDILFEVRLDPAKPEGRFDASVESFLLGDLVLSRCATERQKFDRTPKRIARDGLDHYMFQIFLAGRTEVEVRGRTRVSSPGSIIGFDFTEVLDSWNDDFDVLTYFVPRRLLEPLLRHPHEVQGLVVPPEGLGQLAREYLVGLYRSAPSMSVRDAQVAVDAAIPLIAGALNSAAAGDPEAPELRQAVRHALLAKAKRYIEENLPDSELNAERVGQAIGVSRAGLYRLFEPLGGVAAYTRQRRLRRCLQDLLSPAHGHERITDVALNWGFANTTDFGRAFKQAYGVTPREARREAMLRNLSGPEGGSSDPFGDRRYEQWITNLF